MSNIIALYLLLHFILIYILFPILSFMLLVYIIQPIVKVVAFASPVYLFSTGVPLLILTVVPIRCRHCSEGWVLRQRLST